MRYRVIFFFFFLASICGFSQEHWYEGKPIKDIVFSGLKMTKSSELEVLTFPYKGRIFNDETFNSLNAKLYELEYFEVIVPEILSSDDYGSEVIIKLNVIERPMVGRINFVGISGLRRSELMDAISIKVNDIVNQNKIRAAELAIKEKYLQKGYPNVVVKAREPSAAGKDNAVTLVFDIVEGKKVTIVKITFEGNINFKERTLRGLVSHKAKALFIDGAFQEAKLQLDIDAIKKYYHDRGFIDAEVDCTRYFGDEENTEDAEEGTNLTLIFRVNEGIKYTFDGVTFEGNQIFSTDQLQKLIHSKIGDTVNFSRVQGDLQRVLDLYYENGYIFNTIRWDENKSKDPETDRPLGQLSFNIFITERGRAYIENIIIRGNEKTKTDVIKREIPLEPGDVFSKAKVMNAMRNLYNLQFFSMVIPDTPTGSTENLMDLIFTVEEQPTIDLQFGLTFSGSADPETFPISGLIKWNDRNLRGTGNQLGAELNSSVVDTTSFSLNYLHRWVFGLPLSAGADFSVNYAKRLATMNNSGRLFEGNEPYAFPDGFHSYEEFRTHNRLPPRDYLMEYEQWYLSLGLSSGYRWPTFLGNFGLSGGVRFGLIMNVYDEDIYRPFDPTLRAGANSWMPKNSFWFSLSLDQRDIFYDPSKGYYLFQRMGFYGIFEEEREHFNRADSKAEYYLTLFNIPVSEKWSFKGVLAMHTGLSFIYEQPGRDLHVEDGSKLSVDGMFVGRGWSSQYRNKGLLLWENWVELRFPLVRGILAWDFFFDAAGVETAQGYYFGTNDNGESNFTIENMRFSYGGGLRFTLPQFPFRLSLAKRFSVKDGDFTWEPGALFWDPSKKMDDPANAWMGMDLVISFLLSY
ncbi:MAG: outer membrane protein assembly factor BamA [Treponema sp.]|jgi:outer membrane protein insertion porin family|nr:outer membrane protein assembly factor BamA [Treponema sp.]